MSRLSIFFLILIFLGILSGCSHRNLEDFQEEGEGIVRSLIQDLQAIHSRQELLEASIGLQHQFERLVSVIIAAHEFNLAHPDIEKTGFLAKNSDLSDQLRAELNRLYRMDGGRQIIEKSQEKALHRLDAFEKQQKNQKSDFSLM